MYKNYDGLENYINDISDEEMDRRFNFALQQEIERKKILGLPISRYDKDLKKPYLEFSDGRREYD